MAPPPSTPPPGTGAVAGRRLASRYRLTRPIASGGMAQVWEASDETLNRRVAVKILHQHLAGDPSFVRRFRAEAIAAARLAHPSIVSVYDTLTDGDLEAIVMELVSGTTLRADLDEHGPLRLDAVLAIGTQVADALTAAHASGLVHRDVKPANILLSADGRVLVADFGIAKAAEGGDLTTEGSMVGTAKYLAPEQVEGKPLDGRADVYALGVVLYESLTGQAPFVADSDASTALARLHRDATPPRQLRPDIPVAVEAVVATAMARRPDDRFASAAALRTALLAAGADPSRASGVAAAAAADSGERPTARPPAPPPPRPPIPNSPEGPAPTPPSADGTPGSSRRRWPYVFLGLLVIAGVVWGLLTVVDGGQGSGSGRIVTGTVASTFDPVARDGEHDDQARLAVDGNPDTAWSTESYTTPDLGAPGQKGGVGLIVTLAEAQTLQRIDLTTPDKGWSASIYAFDGSAPSALAGWGDPLASITDAEAGTTRIDVDTTKANAVLVWLTMLPRRGTLALAEVAVRVR